MMDASGERLHTSATAQPTHGAVLRLIGSTITLDAGKSGSCSRTIGS